MPPVPITDPEQIYKCRLEFTVASPFYRPELSTSFHVYDQAGVPRTLAQVADLLDGHVTTWWGATGAGTVRNAFANETVLVNIEVEQPLVDPLPAGAARAIGGAGGSPNLVSANTAVVISLRTDTRGPNYRGRMFLGGLATTIYSADTGGLEALYDTALSTATETMRTNLILDDLPMVVVSRWLDGVLRVPPVRTQVDQAVVGSRIDSQRRRQPNIS